MRLICLFAIQTITNGMNQIGTTEPCLGLSTLCSYGGPKSVPRDVGPMENMLPVSSHIFSVFFETLHSTRFNRLSWTVFGVQFCTPFVQCNWIRTGGPLGVAGSQLCSADDQCGPNANKYLPCCGSIKAWVQETCKDYDNAYIDTVRLPHLRACFFCEYDKLRPPPQNNGFAPFYIMHPPHHCGHSWDTQSTRCSCACTCTHIGIKASFPGF